MARTYQSPFATPFKSAIKRGTPCVVAVNNIASRKNTTPNKVFESLYKGGLCNRQKFNGQWLYWPVNELVPNVNATNLKDVQYNCWQWFIDWCISNNVVTPDQLSNHKGSQQDFESYCKKFWNKQWNVGTGRKRPTTTRGKSRTTTTSRKRSTSGSTLKYRSGSYSNAA